MSEESAGEQAPSPAKQKQFPCGQCGARLEFAAGMDALKCPYCSFENAIPQSEEDVEELDFHTYLEQAAEGEETTERQVMKCQACGAEATLDPDISSDDCPFCGSPIVQSGGSSKVLKPKSLLPFKVDRNAAQKAFRDWLATRWFAPSALYRQAAGTESGFNGLYVPYWTYDCNTVTAYRGERGEDYWDEEEYTTTDSEGNTVRKTRRVRKTRWYPAHGTVWVDFDDVLVIASNSLPRSYAEELEPWDLENLTPYQDEFLSGFRTENYQIDLADGFNEAKDKMEPEIRDAIEDDIGGDRQRIHSMTTRHDHITFKHILLPVWLSAYRYGEDVYRILINARTGEVQGERPWSIIKIAILVVVIITVILGVVYGLN